MTQACAERVDPGQVRQIEGFGGNPRYGIYRTRDGRYLTVSLLEKKFWDTFCRLQGRDDLINPDETEADRLSTHGARGAAYRAFLESTFLAKDRDAWVQELLANEIPVCPVLTPDEVMEAPQAKARGHFAEVVSETAGRAIPQMGFPFHMKLSDGTDAFAIRRGPPRLGEANAEMRVDPAFAARDQA
jgi:crotonobetainyl-CoA:carnitine CoA-transferase CaiB-like acyl-CoA transferase